MASRQPQDCKNCEKVNVAQEAIKSCLKKDLSAPLKPSSMDEQLDEMIRRLNRY